MERKKVNIEDIKGNKIDLLTKRKVESLEVYSPPINGWNRSNTWQVIKSKLEGSNKTVVVWGLAIAASISFLVAASISLNTDAIFYYEPNTSILERSESEINIQHTALKNHLKRKESVLKNVTIKYPVAQNNPPKNFKLPSDIIKSLPTSLTEHSTTIAKQGIKLTPFLSAGYTGISGISPSFGIDFKLFSRTNHHVRHNVNLGGAVTFQKISNEISSKIHTLTILHVGYDRINETTNKGWSTRAGFMVNPDSNVYKNNTVKFSLNRQFNSHIKAGPEVIFTDNFKKAYPGISIVLS